MRKVSWLRLKDNYTIYECIDCNKQETVKSNDYTIDGRTCKHCGGVILPVGEIINGIYLVKGEREMKQYEILLKNGIRFKHTGDVILFNEGDLVKITENNIIYLNVKEVSYVKSMENK